MKCGKMPHSQQNTTVSYFTNSYEKNHSKSVLSAWEINDKPIFPQKKDALNSEKKGYRNSTPRSTI